MNILIKQNQEMTRLLDDIQVALANYFRDRDEEHIIKIQKCISAIKLSHAIDELDDFELNAEVKRIIDEMTYEKMNRMYHDMPASHAYANGIIGKYFMQSMTNKRGKK